MRYSTSGVFPEPPAIRFPTEITGTPNFSDGNNLISNKIFRNLVISPYNTARGKSKNLNDIT
jgi:hypothetical protein